MSVLRYWTFAVLSNAGLRSKILNFDVVISGVAQNFCTRVFWLVTIRLDFPNALATGKLMRRNEAD